MPIETPITLPVCKPVLPSVADLATALSDIDQRRTYSNNGPLLARFAEAFTATSGAGVRMVGQANGTLAIQTALLAACGFGGAARPLCLMPSFTFAASPAAVMAAGYQPYFVDINAQNWMLDPAALRHHPRLAEARAVLVVSAFGAMPDLEAWGAFARDTGLAVIVDGAASADAFLSGAIPDLHGVPVTLSFHATKAFGLGEGGAVLCDDEVLLQSIRTCSNFGFGWDRQADQIGTNAKMSEYVAAMGLALLAQWPARRAQMMALVEHYHHAFAGAQGFHMVRDWVATYPHVLSPDLDTRAAQSQALARAGIEHRRWWKLGCHTHPAYAEIARDPLPVTEDIAPRLIGLPFFPNMTRDQVNQVAQVVLGS